jgi:hypothetical protein
MAVANVDLACGAGTLLSNCTPAPIAPITDNTISMTMAQLMPDTNPERL